MNEKGLETVITLEETPNFSETEEKPLKSKNFQTKKVDINVLKARAQEIEDKEKKRNVGIFIFFLAVIAGFGVFLSI